MCRIDPWTWIQLWLETWEDDWEPDLFEIFQFTLMQELENLLETNPYHHQTDDSDTESDSDWDAERFCPEVCPEDLDPSNGQNWELTIKGELQKTL